MRVRRVRHADHFATAERSDLRCGAGSLRRARPRRVEYSAPARPLTHTVVMPLRIGFDLDGVLAAMESELVRQAEILFGEQMTRRLREPVSPIEIDGAAAGQQAAGQQETNTPAD